MQRLRRIGWRRWLMILLAIVALPFVGLAALRGVSALNAIGKIYTLEDAPQRPVAIVFGAQVLPSGRLSAMLNDRVQMGAALYHAGKVRALLLTGDNGTVEYNEPEAMRDYAIGYGVPEDSIFLDYAGFRTYDSCYRAHDIFQVDEAILVTQGFHLDRALLTCNALGVESIGVAADAMRDEDESYARRALMYSTLREIPSTALSVFDLLRGDLPMYLGDPIPIFPEEAA